MAKDASLGASVLYLPPLQLKAIMGGNVELPEERILESRIEAAFDQRFTKTQNVYRDNLESLYEQTQERKYRMNLI